MKTVLAITAVILTNASVAYAEEVQTVLAPSQFVERVSYDVSELATQSGIRGLQSRVTRATQRVCAPSENTFAVTYNGGRRCMRLTRNDAFAQIDLAVQRHGADLAIGPQFITIAAR